MEQREGGFSQIPSTIKYNKTGAGEGRFPVITLRWLRSIFMTDTPTFPAQSVHCEQVHFSCKCPAEIKSCYLLRDLTHNKLAVIISSRNVFNPTTDNVVVFAVVRSLYCKRWHHLTAFISLCATKTIIWNRISILKLLTCDWHWGETSGKLSILSTNNNSVFMRSL